VVLGAQTAPPGRLSLAVLVQLCPVHHPAGVEMALGAALEELEVADTVDQEVSEVPGARMAVLYPLEAVVLGRVGQEPGAQARSGQEFGVDARHPRHLPVPQQ